LRFALTLLMPGSDPPLEGPQYLLSPHTRIIHCFMQEAAQPSERAMVAQFLKPLKQAIDAALEAYQVEMQPVRR